MVDSITCSGETLALLIPANYSSQGVEFFTPQHFSQQLGYMRRPAGYQIAPHVHNTVKRDIHWTQEVLIIRSGRVRVDLYTSEQEYVTSRVLTTGDVILLCQGGHGFEMLEETEMIEIKQGPYCGDEDKIRFVPARPQAFPNHRMAA